MANLQDNVVPETTSMFWWEDYTGALWAALAAGLFAYKALFIIPIRSCRNRLSCVADGLSTMINICSQIFYNADKSSHYSL